MVSIFWAHNLITLNHIPVNYRCPDGCCVGIRNVYLKGTCCCKSLWNCCGFCPLYPQNALHLQQLTLSKSLAHGKFVKGSIQTLINVPSTKDLYKLQCHPNLQAETKLVTVIKKSKRGHVLTGNFNWQVLNNSPKVSTLPWPRNIFIFGIVQKLQFMASPSSQLSGQKLHNCLNPYTPWSSTGGGGAQPSWHLY